jgi:hypothetical protein
MGLKGKGRELPVSVRLGFPINNQQEQRVARLEIHDETAGVLLLEVELDPAQLMAILGNSAAHVTAWMPKSLNHIGKRMEHESTVIGTKYEMTEEAAQAAATAWAAQNDWHTVSVSATNVGTWVAVGRRWVDPE